LTADTALRLAEQLSQERIDLKIAAAALMRTEDRASRKAWRRLAKEWAAYGQQERFWR
jgi:hypothetical protein